MHLLVVPYSLACFMEIVEVLYTTNSYKLGPMVVIGPSSFNKIKMKLM